MQDFAEEFARLYGAAGGGTSLTLGNLVSFGKKHRFQVGKSSIDDWLNGRSVPTREGHVRYVRLLLQYLEGLAASQHPGDHQRIAPGTWDALLRAAQRRSKSRQGGSGARIHAESPGRLLAQEAAIRQSFLSRDFVGREKELDELWAFAASPAGQGPDYAWWQADAWAGKTALLAWFVLQSRPTGVDIVSHFIAGRLGTNTRDDYVRAVTDQLASLAQRKAAAAGKERGLSDTERRDRLFGLYEEAARASIARDRKLLLVVDGLDEDALTEPDRYSIAALLPRELPPGMRVLVSGRLNPSVPDDVPDDHPLRDPSVIRRLTASPTAGVIRDTARRELRALLKDRDVGRPLVGFLTVAGGALSGNDLAELVDVLPFDIDETLGSVVGRNMAPGNTDRLALGPHTDPHRQTYILAHEQLREEAVKSLGEDQLAKYKADLRTWAGRYQDQGWPEGTPDYLLTGYTRFVQRGANVDRLADLVLDTRRQLRLVSRSGTDVALADLDLLAAGDKRDTGDTAQGLDLAAGVSVSREFLLRHVRTLPRVIPGAVARLGDAPRARALALAFPRDVDKAAALADVARVLADTGHEQAPGTAREAATWAESVRRHASSLAGDDSDEQAAAALAAVALLATRQEEAGLALLRSTRGPGTARYGAWVEAARLLLSRDRRTQADELLDALEEEAEDLAYGDPRNAAVPMQLWAIVAEAAPERGDRLYDRLLGHTRRAWEDSPTAGNVALLTTAASALAGARREESVALAELAMAFLEAEFRDAGARPEAERVRLFSRFQSAFRGLVQALADTGLPTEPARRLLEQVPDEWRDLSAQEAAAGDEGDDTADGSASGDLEWAEPERLAEEALRLAAAGQDHQAKLCLQRAMELLAPAGAGTTARTGWLPVLAGELVRLGRPADAEALTAVLSGPGERARALAEMSAASAESGDAEEARRRAREAADCARAAQDVADGGAGGAVEGWAFAAQALACAGEADKAVQFIEEAQPSERTARAAWRREVPRARMAVAAGIAAHDPAGAAVLVDEERERLMARRHRPRGTATLLADLAELWPAAAAAGEPCKERLHEALRGALAYTSEPPEAWKPETVLVHALLRIGAGQDASAQLDWLAREFRIHRTESLPAAALAVVHALVGDTSAARHVADRLATAESRAAAFAAVAEHLARIPVRVRPRRDPADHPRPHPLTTTARALALAASPHTTADAQAATGFARRALEGAGWHHALPVLTQLAPEAVVRIRDITFAHLRIPPMP